MKWILPTIVGLALAAIIIGAVAVITLSIHDWNDTHNETLTNNVDTAAYMDAQTILNAVSYNLDERNTFCNTWNTLKLNAKSYTKAAGTLHRIFAERDRVKQHGLILNSTSGKAMNRLGTQLDEHCATIQLEKYSVQ